MSKKSVPVILLPDEDGGYSVMVPLFPGCNTQGDTPQEALENAKEAMELLLEEPTEFDLECLELLNISHVVLGRVEVDIPVPPKVKTRD